MKDMTRNLPVDTTDVPPVNKQKKIYKAKDLSQELAAEKARNIELMEALEQSHQIIEDLRARQAERDEGGIDFDRGTGFSSTQRPSAVANMEESRFYTSINQLSVASVSIPECKPTDDGEIHRQSFEAWKDLLVDSMTLAGIEDEQTKFIIFKVKAGAMLLEIFKNTKSSNEDPDVDNFPFENAMSRLKSYFGSGSDVMLMRRKLALLSQKQDESDLSYVTRVGSMARLCEFDGPKEFEQIVATIAEHATNRDVRTAALKMLSRNQCFIDLVDKVREIETIKLNEEFIRKKYHTEQAVVASINTSVARKTNRTAYHTSQRGARHTTNWSIRGDNKTSRGRQSYVGGGDLVRATAKTKCWRCHSIYHEADVCGHRDKTCNYCGILGHIQRACRRAENMKRFVPEPPETNVKKIAAIDEVQDHLESVEPVSQCNDL